MSLSKEQFLQLASCKKQVFQLKSMDAEVELKQLSAADQESWINDTNNSVSKLVSLCLVTPKLTVDEIRTLNIDVVKELQDRCIEINNLDADKKKS